MKKHAHDCHNACKGECEGGESPDCAEPEVVEKQAVETPEAKPDPLEVLKAENAALKDQYLRSVADLENYRRRVNREKDELRKYAVDSLLEEFLPALDNLRLGLVAAAASPEGKNLTAGFGMVGKQIQKVLAEHGLTEVNPEGKLFDPNEAEAAAHEPSDIVPENHVSAVQRVGYRLHDRLLRPAIVVVSSGPKA